VEPATSETTAGDESSTGSGLSCERVLWVLGDLNVMATADALFYERLMTVGYDVTLVLNADGSPDGRHRGHHALRRQPGHDLRL
jgi:hypothetical protein